MYDSRYLARNPYLQAPAAAVNIAPAGKFTKLYRVSPVEPWRTPADATAEPGDRAGLGRGGHAVGLLHRRHRRDRLSRRRFPPEFHGNLFVGEVANNLIHRAIPVAGRRARDGPERRAGPRVPRLARQRLPPGADGQRPRRLPLGHRHVPRADRGGGLPAAADPQAHGRRQRRRSRPDLADRARGTSSRGSPGWARRRRPSWSPCWSTPTAGTATRPRGCCTSGRIGRRSLPCGGWPPDRSRPSAARTRSTRWPGSARSSRATSLAALGDPDPRIRVHALRLAEPFCRDDRAHAGPDRRQMVGDTDPMVRYQLAFSLGVLPGRKRPPRSGRAGGPRRGRSLDADGDPQLGDAAARARSSHGWPATPASGPRQPAGPFLTDLVGQTGAAEPSRRPGRDPRGAGWPAGRRTGPVPCHRRWP